SQLPGERISVRSNAPAQRCSQNFAEAAPKDRMVLCSSANLVIQQEELQCTTKAPELFSLQPRQDVFSQRQLHPFAQRLRLVAARFTQLRQDRNSRIRREDVG